VSKESAKLQFDRLMDTLEEFHKSSEHTANTPGKMARVSDVPGALARVEILTKGTIVAGEVLLPKMKSAIQELKNSSARRLNNWSPQSSPGASQNGHTELAGGREQLLGEVVSLLGTIDEATREAISTEERAYTAVEEITVWSQQLRDETRDVEEEMKRVQQEIAEVDEALERKALEPSPPAPPTLKEDHPTPLGDLNDADTLRRLIYGGMPAPAPAPAVDYGAMSRTTRMDQQEVEHMLDVMILDEGAPVHPHKLEQLQALLVRVQGEADRASLSLRQELHTKKLERDRVARKRDEAARACDEAKRGLPHSPGYRGFPPRRTQSIQGADAMHDTLSPSAVAVHARVDRDEALVALSPIGAKNGASLSELLMAQEAEAEQKAVLALQPEGLRRANSILQNALELERMDLQYV